MHPLMLLCKKTRLIRDHGRETSRGIFSVGRPFWNGDLIGDEESWRTPRPSLSGTVPPPSEIALTRRKLWFFNSIRILFKVSIMVSKLGRASGWGLQQLLIIHWRFNGQWEVWVLSIFGRSPPLMTSLMCLALEYPTNGFSDVHISQSRIPKL